MDIRQHPQFGTWYRRTQSQPSWVVKASLTLAALVIVVPLVVLTVAAIVVGLAAFVVLGLIATVLRAVREVVSPPQRTPMATATPPDSGRINVRVIRD